MAPEMWPWAAEVFGIEELTAATLEVADYRSSMEIRIAALRGRGVSPKAVCEAIARLGSMDGAVVFVEAVGSVGPDRRPRAPSRGASSLPFPHPRV